MRAWVRIAAGLLAIGCLAISAYLAFDWADYGDDSTCGNFIRYKGAGPPCAEIMQHRLIGVVALVVLALALAVVAVSTRTGATSD
jgi:hypothetical protein